MVSSRDREALIWSAAIELAETGEVNLLVSALRNISLTPPRRALELAADFLEGERKAVRRRGVTSRARDHASTIRAVFEQLRSDDYMRHQTPEFCRSVATVKAKYAYIGSLFNLSPETVRDVIERRKTFGEK